MRPEESVDQVTHDVIEQLPLALDASLDRTSKGIAVAVGRLISSGELPAGAKLPTVRAVAKQLSVSPTTVGDAWRILRSHGAVSTDGRRGTFVRVPRQGVAPGRYWRVPVDPETHSLDLSTGTPDPDLLPPLGEVLAKVPADLPVTSYLDAQVLPELEAVLRRSWPFPPALLSIVDGAQDGLDRLVSAVVNLGDTVLINDPAFPPVLDMLDLAGAQVIGLPMDAEGIRMDALTAALEHRPTALFIQPRSHNPTGISLSAERSRQVASALSNPDLVDRDLVVIEDDHSGDVSGAPLHSVGVHLPDRVVQVRSFSKSHGPDLRLACIGGAAGPIDTVVRRRRLGPSWTSRLLQRILLAMLEDPQTAALIQRADREYGRRRTAFVDAMAGHGIAVGGDSGINLWIPVADQQTALVILAANGIGAAPGEPFNVSPSDQHHIRISIGPVSDEIEDVVAILAKAATAHGRH